MVNRWHELRITEQELTLVAVIVKGNVRVLVSAVCEIFMMQSVC